MKVRRVATGHTPQGKATLASDVEVDATTVALLPGFEFHLMWGADEKPTFPDAGERPHAPNYFPPLDGFRFTLISFAPEALVRAANVDRQMALPEVREKLPGLSECMEPDHPGMHTTDTIDFDYVISGEIWLELDDGKEVLLKTGDTVVQNGTRHAWHNKSAEPCRVLFCVIGAHRR